MDMVRAGISIYGMYPSDEVNKMAAPHGSGYESEEPHCLYQRTSAGEARSAMEELLWWSIR